MNLVIKGNTKMGPKVGIWNLPPIRTCTPSPWCHEHCYALRNNFLLASVQKSLQWRLQQSLRADFVPRMIKEACRYELFRIHAAGDFYNHAYVDKWFSIVSACPGTLFRTTTRRRDLLGSLERLHKLSNMIVRESLDPIQSTPVTGLPVAGIVGTAKGALRCVDDCVACGYKCWKRAVSVQFAEF